VRGIFSPVRYVSLVRGADRGGGPTRQWRGNRGRPVRRMDGTGGRHRRRRGIDEGESNVLRGDVAACCTRRAAPLLILLCSAPDSNEVVSRGPLAAAETFF
jgi:hypothetical protein